MLSGGTGTGAVSVQGGADGPEARQFDTGYPAPEGRQRSSRLGDVVAGVNR